MAYLVTASVVEKLDEVRTLSPGLWRDLRRFNLPVQLALAAAWRVRQHASSPRRLLVVSLAPCQTGSPQLFGWAEKVALAQQRGHVGALRVNPTHTLHAVDNLALSAFAILADNQQHCLGLGGAPGQAWCALETVLERFEMGQETEALVMAGDQEADGASGLGVAFLFSRHVRTVPDRGKPVRLLSVTREALAYRNPVAPHAARGLAALAAALRKKASTGFIWTVPHEDGNGFERIRIIWETA